MSKVRAPVMVRDAAINRFQRNRVFLLHGMELLQLVQNENKVTLAVHQLKMTCLSETQRILHALD